MTNKKRKGFTIVELVIVIAVIAILAGVLIPTFASIIDKANQSADIQAVRQMNVVLMAESVEDKPTDVNKVIEIVAKAGYDTVEKRTPKSKNHGFYWHIGTNTIILVKTTNPAELIYPLDNEELRNAFVDKKADWTTGHAGFYDLADSRGSGGNEIYDAAGLIAALTTEGKTGTISLDADIILSRDDVVVLNDSNEPEVIKEKVEIICTAGKADEPLVIDLNGHTLTIGECASAVIEGNIKIIGTANDADMDIIIPFFDGEYFNSDNNSCGTPYRDYFRAFYVLEGGTLSLENLDIDAGRTGNSSTNIYNEGTVNLNGINFKLNGSPDDFKITALTNCGTADIIGGSFIANGKKVQAIYGKLGSMTINGTQFFDSISKEDSRINMIEWDSNGTLTLINAKFNDSDDLKTNTYGNGVAASNGTVKISGGTYNCSLSLTGSNKAEIEEILEDTNLETLSETATFNGSVTCCGGTIYAGNFSGGFKVGAESNVTISGGTFTKTVTVGGSNSNLTIKGGTFEYESGTIVLCELGSGNGAIVNIIGGQFNGMLKVDARNAAGVVYEAYLVSCIYFYGDAKIFYNDNEGYVKVDKLLTELSTNPNNLKTIITGYCHDQTEDDNSKLLIGNK